MENVLKFVLTVIGVSIVFGFIATICSMRMEQYKEQTIAIESTDYPTTAHIEEELSCMAMNIYREAAGEPFEGKVAVAQVTMNRVKNGKDFPDTVCSVVHEKNIFMKRVVCQFSWYCSKVVRARPVNSIAYDESYEVAKKVMLENFELDILKDAMYYHADSISPNWNYQVVTKIGGHIFYKDKS